ncbi:ABC transporter ATP-binding protein [Henriciella aquimarina]|uniref:ABC transporter ATP-binding protein n=1 Tax=Henriciella aquimarina TaxID=545261 RepID=UPI000A077672|nr:ABC transporter ATP-binding protein [Henriciella aquimarina]
MTERLVNSRGHREPGFHAASIQLNSATVEIGGTRLIDTVNLELCSGMVTGLIGPNGAGKSTLLKVLARQLPLTSGEYLLGDRQFSSYGTREFSRLVGYLPQTTPPTPGLTVEEVVRMGRFPWHGALGPFTAKDSTAVAEALAITEMTGFAKRFADTLSGGERQRCWIAMLLAQEAGILLLDEPVSALDLRYQAGTMDLIQKISRTRDISVLVILHDINLAARFCDDIVALKNGEVAWKGLATNLVNAATLETIYDTRMTIVSSAGSKEQFAFVKIDGQDHLNN